MAQINNSEPTHPIITFQVSLATVDSNSFLQPTQYQSNQDRGRQDNTNLSATRVTYIPGLLVGENRELYDGQQFTLYGAKAQYYRAEIAKGNYPMLTIVSQT